MWLQPGSAGLSVELKVHYDAICECPHFKGCGGNLGGHDGGCEWEWGELLGSVFLYFIWDFSCPGLNDGLFNVIDQGVCQASDPLCRWFWGGAHLPGYLLERHLGWKEVKSNVTGVGVTLKSEWIGIVFGVMEVVTGAVFTLHS